LSGITFSLDGLEESVRAIVREELSRLQFEGEERWYSAAEAAEYLRVTVQRIHDLRSEGRLPRHGEKGHSLRFRRSDLDACVRRAGDLK
jgi:excisionase family DNA binding protein